MKKTVFQLEPLTCPSCVKKIENTLLKTKGVDSVKVLFNSSKVRVDFDDSQISTEQLRNIIIKLGYDVLTTKEP